MSEIFHSMLDGRSSRILCDKVRHYFFFSNPFVRIKLTFYIAGNVVFADVLTLPNGRSKGCGIVEYSTREEAQKAVQKLSHLELDGREIFVREDREAEPKFGSRLGGAPPPIRGHQGPPPPPSGGGVEGAQIFVGNLPYSVGWQELKDLFREAGDVVRADVQQTHQGRSKGCGTVLFSSAEDAQTAIAKFNAYDMSGRAIEVREDRFVQRSGRDFGAPPPFGAHGSGRSLNSSTRGGSGSGGAPPSRYESSSSSAVISSSSKPNSFTDGATGNGPVSETIFVSNLPWATTDNDLMELFQTVGRVERAEIQLEAGGRSAGAGVVKFDTPASADIAIEKFSGYNYGNRPLSLSFAGYRSEPPI